MTETARRLKREARRQTPASERLPGNSWSSPHASSIRSFIAKKAAKAVTAAKNQGKRKKRRKGTWTQSPRIIRSVGGRSVGIGPAPPPT